MANNRMYLCNARLGVRVLLAKTLAEGWYIPQEDTIVDRIENAFWRDGAGEGATDWVIAYEHTDEGVPDADDLVPYA